MATKTLKQATPEGAPANEAPKRTSKKKDAANKAALLAQALTQQNSKIDVEERRTRLKNLIMLGKERGYLTYAEVNDHLPDEMLDAEQIESVISMINDMGIQVFDQAPAAEDLLMSETPRRLPTKMPSKQPKPRYPTSMPNSAAPPTRCACTCAKWAPRTCSPAKAKSKSPSASKKASSTWCWPSPPAR
jgi:hypothetical protein